jgi:hypothetical protein
MSSQTAMTLMAVVEFALWASLGFLFWTKGQHRRFPAMGGYLALRVGSMPVLLFFFYAQARHWYNNYAFVMYFYSFWAVYIASAVFLYFVCIEVFRSAFSAFSGLQRLGTVVFRWAALVAVIVSFSTLSFEYPKVCIIPTIAFRLMRSVSLVELCLLAFLCLSMNALRLSFRSMVFGISLGFGVMCSSDLFAATFLYHNTSLISPLQFVGESLILVALGIWITYAALPERVRQPVLLPDNSTIYLWNEIAFSLDHTETQVAARQPAKSFFPSDVELVDVTVMKRSLKGRESET